MKKAFSIVVLLAMLSIMLFSVASAAPTGTYVTGIACVNLEASSGDFSITFYAQDGSTATQITDTIAANGSKQYFTPSIGGLPDGFAGSAVVSSTVQMACSVNTQTSGGTLRVGTSNGVDSNATADMLYAPQVMNNLSGWSSYIAVQNTSGTDAYDVTVKYFNSSGTEVASETENVPANSSHVFYQDEASSGLPAGFIGSATVESTGLLAGTVAMYNAGTGGSDAQFLSYNAFTAGAAKVYGPRVVKNLSGVGFTSGYSCQNVGDVATDISAAFSILDQDTSTTVSETMTATSVAPGQSWAIYMGATGNANLDAIGKGVGSVTIESTTAPVSCIFNEDNRTTYAGLGSTYSGVPDGDQSTTVFFSQIVALGSSSYRGGFQIANTTSTATTCDYTFSNGDVISGVALAADGSNSVFAESVLVNDKTSFNGSAVVTCGQPIVGIYNLAALSIAGDSFATNNGINQ